MALKINSLSAGRQWISRRLTFCVCRGEYLVLFIIIHPLSRRSHVRILISRLKQKLGIGAQRDKTWAKRLDKYCSSTSRTMDLRKGEISRILAFTSFSPRCSVDYGIIPGESGLRYGHWVSLSMDGPHSCCRAKS